MEKVYIVYFCTGEYEDRTEEVYKVFQKEIDAKLCKENLERELKEQKLDIGSNYHDNEDNRNFHGHRVDYTGAWITIAGPFDLN